MTNQELETLLTDKINTFELKKTAFDTLSNIFLENSDDKNFLCGFTQNEIKTIFDRFEYHINRRQGNTIIKTRIGLYVENQNWNENLEPIGFYELESNLKGEILDDWFVIEKEKYLKDIEIISLFEIMNNKIPIEYLRRNHIQYTFVSYISMVGTLFISKQFESAGRFIIRAYNNLETVESKNFNKEYLKEAKNFLKIVSFYLVKSNLITEKLKQELIDKKN